MSRMGWIVFLIFVSTIGNFKAYGDEKDKGTFLAAAPIQPPSQNQNPPSSNSSGPNILNALPTQGPSFQPVAVGGSDFANPTTSYFKPVTGLKTESEVVDYQEGGKTPGSPTLQPFVKPSVTDQAALKAAFGKSLLEDPKAGYIPTHEIGHAGLSFVDEYTEEGMGSKTLPDSGKVGVLPEIDDEVLVAFEHGDTQQPVKIGSLWNSKDSTGLDSKTSSGPSQFQGQIDSMQNNNMMFLAIQTKVQNLSQQFQVISNILKADSDAKSNAIKNMRDGGAGQGSGNAELKNWYGEAHGYYDSVTEGTQPKPSDPEWQEFLGQMKWAQEQLGGATDWGEGMGNASFNPKEIAVDKSVPWQKHKNTEGDSPTLEFTAGEPKTMNAELMFDTYESEAKP